MKDIVKIDLHTHSTTSYDGGISREDYLDFLKNNPNFIIAITDHNEISFAQSLATELPMQVIVGEEILTEQGEVIGLFLSSKIEAGQSLRHTINQIKEQDGLVYIPHPFEISRKGIAERDLLTILRDIDIVEVYNARTKEPWLRKKIAEFAQKNELVVTASSDAHGTRGLNSGYAELSDWPTQNNFLDILNEAKLCQRQQSWLGFFDPFKNKLRKFFHG